MANTISPSNFGKQNTPPVIQKIGDALLLIGALGGVVAILPLSASVITVVGAWVAVAGLLGKTITKFYGDSQKSVDPTLPCIIILLGAMLSFSSCNTTQQSTASMNVRYIMTSADGSFKVGLTFNVKDVTPAYLDSLINSKTQNIFDVEKLYVDSLGSHADAVITIPPLK